MIKDKPILFVGIDPGSSALGYSLGEIDILGNFLFLKSGVLMLCGEFAEKIEFAFDFVNDLLYEYSKTHFIYITLETPFLKKFPQAYFVLGQIRGVLLLAARKNKAFVLDVSPREVKKKITSKGSSSKVDVKFYIQHLFGIDSKQLDESDAQAIMIYGIMNYLEESL